MWINMPKELRGNGVVMGFFHERSSTKNSATLTLLSRVT
jgi:hypothetical protein